MDSSKLLTCGFVLFFVFSERRIIRGRDEDTAGLCTGAVSRRLQVRNDLIISCPRVVLFLVQ